MNEQVNAEFLAAMKKRMAEQESEIVKVAHFYKVMGQYTHFDADERIDKVLKPLVDMPKAEKINALLTCLIKIEGKQLSEMEHTEIWSERRQGDLLFYWEDGNSLSKLLNLLRRELRLYFGLPPIE